MQKLSVSEAAEILGITKEAVYNRIRRGSLKSLEKDGQKFVILEKEPENQNPKSAPKPRKNANESEFVKYLLNELNELKAQNLSLQGDKERLFKEKEQMLITSKQEISQIYKERDEKLTAFLNAMQKPFLAHKDEPAIEAVIENESERAGEKEKKWQNLSEFLRERNLDAKTRKKAQKALIKHIGRIKFIKFKDGVILIRKNKTLKEVINETR